MPPTRNLKDYKLECYKFERGLNHPPKCPLCDQVGETIDHLLVSLCFHPTVLVQYPAEFWSTSYRATVR